MRWKNVLCNTIIIVLSSTGICAETPPPRIARTIIDKRKVQKLYIAHGKSSILIFPCNIKTFSPGPTRDISAALNERDSKYLEVWLSSNSNQPGDLKVICNDNYYSFDVIPSSTVHQDFLEVKGSFGVPPMLTGITAEPKATNVITSQSTRQTAKNNLPKIIRVISSSQSTQESGVKQ